MRKRWMAGLVGALALAGGAASMAQKSDKTPPLRLADQAEPTPHEPKRWRSPADPQIKGEASPPRPLPPAMPADSAFHPAQAEPVQPAPPAVGDDPMDAVESFLRRSRKEADDSIQALAREAETLRARLQKVEAALGRWQAVSDSLKLDRKTARGEDPAGDQAKPVEGDLEIPRESPPPDKAPSLPVIPHP